MSNDNFYRQGQCNETSGFLFSHPCSESSEHVCGECQKPICGKHAVDTQGVLRCTTCAKTWFRGAGRSTGATGGPGYYDPYYQSPYFYTWHAFGSSHHHHHHFHDGDEDALRGREPGRDDLEGFEKDMGAS